jgi:cell division protein FtsL
VSISFVVTLFIFTIIVVIFVSIIIIIIQGINMNFGTVKFAIKFRRKKLNTNAGYVNNMKGTVDHLTSGCQILANN